VILNETRPHSYIVDLWSYCAQFARHGDLSDLDALDIAIGSGWEGDAEVFVDALVRCEFLDRDERGLYVHDWHEHQGALIEKREKDAERARAYRERQKTERERHTDVTPTSAVTNERTNVTNDTNEEKKGRKRPTFTPPTIEDIQAFSDENTLDLDAQHVWDFYQSKGWMVGRNKMKDWQAAVRGASRSGWGRRGAPGRTTPKRHPLDTGMQSPDHIYGGGA
jgi:hypothetical protein